MDFWQSANGSLQFDLRDGGLPHISLTGDDEPLQVARWQGLAILQDGKIEIDKGKLVTPAETYQVTGSATLGQTLDLELTQGSDLKSAHPGSPVYSITGTVAEPHVALTTPETQARLKP